MNFTDNGGESKSSSDFSENDDNTAKDIHRITPTSTHTRDTTNIDADAVDLMLICDEQQDIPACFSKEISPSVNPYDSSNTSEQSSDDESLQDSEPISSCSYLMILHIKCITTNVQSVSGRSMEWKPAT